MNTIYLDHNATTPLDPVVADVMARVMREQTANPASQHEPGRQARRQLETAREAIAEILDADPRDRVVFTSGGTEANNWALRGLMAPGGTLITSSIEHPSITETANTLKREGCLVRILSATEQGVVDLSSLSTFLNEGAQLVSVMLANNETGVRQPVENIVYECARYEVPVHTDAVQVAGKLPISFRSLGVAAMTIAAHKFHGPLGIGALIVRHNVTIRPLLSGGFQQAGLRPGTESVVLAVGMLKALEQWKCEALVREIRMKQLRDQFERIITSAIPCASIIGGAAPRLPHTSNISFIGCDRQVLVVSLDLRGVACSTGSACASGSSEPSPVLQAMGLAPQIVNSSVRFSLGALTTKSEIEEAAKRVIAVVRQADNSQTLQ